ncbi:MAG: phage terminase large subunit [Deferribacterales bacterium]
MMKTDPRAEACRKARDSLISYCMLSSRDFAPGWHHRLLAGELELLEKGETDRLMVMMPPRHGKSELASVRFPAWFMGRNPKLNVIACSYSAELAESFSRRVREQTASRLFTGVFGGRGLKQGARSAARWELAEGGRYLAAGAGGSITGQGGHLIIIDDPVKNSEQASSAVYRDKLWDWYRSTLFTRLEQKGRIILVQTRWHEDDLAGRLLAEYPDEWKIIRLPAVAAEDEPFRKSGEPLWPARYGTEELARIKQSVGSRVWNALYMQEPAPDSGTVLKREWWRYYKVLPSEPDCWFQSWDMSFKGGEGSDYVVGQVWAVKGSCRYLADMVRERMDFSATLRAVRSLSALWPQAGAKYVEDKANGSAVLSALRKEIQGMIAVEPKGSKISRAYAVQPLLEAGNVYLPEGKAFAADLVEEAAAFPFGRHDDMVDALTQALSEGGKTALPEGVYSGKARSAGSIFRGY